MTDTKKTSAAVVLTLLIILTAGAALRCYRIGDPFGGYHSLNEAWYASTARNFEHNSILNPTVTKGLVDYKVRPVYPYLAYLADKAFGVNEASPRLVSVLFSLLGILLIYLIGCRIATQTAGLIAAAFLATGPAYSILGRQAQPDAAYVTLTLAALWLYLVSRGHKRESLLKFAAGILWGVAVFTKNFAVLLLPGIFIAELIESKSLRLINRRLFWILLPAAIIPAPFLIYHFISHPGVIRDIYSRPAIHWPTPGIAIYMAKEIIWAVSPPVFALGAAGLAAAFYKRRVSGIWLVSLAFPFFILYFFLHVHSYYLLGFIPFLTLGAALPFSETKTAARWAPLLIAIALLSLLQTSATLASCKWDKTQFRDVGAAVEKNGGSVAMVLSPDVSGSYASLFYYYLPDALVYYRDDIKRDNDGYAMIPPERRVYMVDFFHGSRRPEKGQNIYGSNILALTLAGKSAIWIPFAIHSFIPKQIKIINAPVSGSGFPPVAYSPNLIVTEMPAGYRLRHLNGSWLFQPEDQK
ncbi:MAG: glycosyltransferase family 39 protein [bacterium]